MLDRAKLTKDGNTIAESARDGGTARCSRTSSLGIWQRKDRDARRCRSPEAPPAALAVPGNPIALVAKQEFRPEIRVKQVRDAVTVVVGYCSAHAVSPAHDERLFHDVPETPVAEVPVGPVPILRLGLPEAGGSKGIRQIGALDEIQVETAVAVDFDASCRNSTPNSRTSSSNSIAGAAGGDSANKSKPPRAGFP